MCSLVEVISLTFVSCVLGVWERWGRDGFPATERNSSESNSRYAMVEQPLESHHQVETFEKGAV
jgi:hypothetical protein